MRNLFLLIIFLCPLITAQEFNSTVIDSESGKPMLTGYCNLDAFKDTSFSWWWNSSYNLYDVDINIVDEFAEELSDVDIKIILGTWCSDSRREVPHLIKILEETGYPVDHIIMIAVNRDRVCNGIETNKLNIELVPTFIFYRNGKEIGRIVESPAESLEFDIQKILHG